MRTLGVVAVALVLASACGVADTQDDVVAEAPSRGAAPADSEMLEGRGLLVVSDGEARFCKAAPTRETLETGIPHCVDGITVTGAPAEALPRPARADDTVWDLVVVTGELQDDIFEVATITSTRPAPLPAPQTDEGVGSGGYSSEELDRIWAVQLAPELEQVRGYLAEIGEAGRGLWWDHDDPTHLLVAVSADAATHQRAIEEIWPHAVTVREQAWSPNNLYELMEQMRDDRQLRAQLPGGVLEVVQGDAVTMTIDVITALDDATTRDILEQTYGAVQFNIDPLFVSPGSLTPVPPERLRVAGEVLAGLPGIPVGDVEVPGTVVRTDGETGLCLGLVLESDPPQCELALPLEVLDESAADVLLERQYAEGTFAGDWTGDVLRVTSYTTSRPQR